MRTKIIREFLDAQPVTRVLLAQKRCGFHGEDQYDDRGIHQALQMELVGIPREGLDELTSLLPSSERDLDLPTCRIEHEEVGAVHDILTDVGDEKITYTIQGSLTLADGFMTPVWMVAPIDPGVAISGPHADEYDQASLLTVELFLFGEPGVVLVGEEYFLGAGAGAVGLDQRECSVCIAC